MSGIAIDVSPKHALALHELATNATKYGALSRPEGCVTVQWDVQEGMLHLGWEESGRHPVAPPTQKGFRSRAENLQTRNYCLRTPLQFRGDCNF